MTTINLNNENKTEITFSYDNGLPYKKAIRPNIEYGNWKKDESKTLIKIKLSDEETDLFNDIKILRNHLYLIIKVINQIYNLI